MDMITKNKLFSAIMLSYAAVGLLAMLTVECCMSKKRMENEEKNRQIEETARENIKNILNRVSGLNEN